MSEEEVPIIGFELKDYHIQNHDKPFPIRVVFSDWSITNYMHNRKNSRFYYYHKPTGINVPYRNGFLGKLLLWYGNLLVKLNNKGV
jgi:hypothetical protein